MEEGKDKDKSPVVDHENTEYGPDVRELLDELGFPSDASAYTMNCSPGYRPYQGPSSTNTPAPQTPNEPGTDMSNGTSKDGTIERNLTRRHQEAGGTYSHIEESDLSSISNAGATSQQIAFVNAEGSHSMENTKISKMRREPETSVRHHRGLKKSEEAAMFPKIHAPTVEIPLVGCDGSPFESADNVTARKGLECEESLSLTPSHTGQSRGKQWTFTPNDTSEIRRSQRENENTTSPEFLSNHEGRKKIVSRAACEDAKLNLEAEIQRHIADVECMLSEDFHKLKLELTQTRIRANALNEENTELRAELDTRVNELTELALAFEDQRNRANELEEHLALMEQQIRDPTKIHTLRGQALENAKTEIAQMRIHLQARDKRIMELESIVSKREVEERAEGNSTFKQINELCADVQKYKILLSAASRQVQEMQDTLNTNQMANKDVQAQWDANNKEMISKIKALESEKKKLESYLKEHKTALDKQQRTNQTLEKNIRELSEKYEKAFTELNEAKEEIEQFGGNKYEPKESLYTEQIVQIKDQFNKRIQSLNEELLKAKDAIKRKDAQIVEYEKKLQEDPLMDLVGEPNNNENNNVELLDGIKKLLELKEEENLQDKIEELLAEVEEYKLVKAQHQRMEEALQESQKTIAELNEQLEEERKRWGQIEAIQDFSKKDELERRIGDLQSSNEQLGKSKVAMQTQLNNMNEILKVKEQEITILKQSRDLAENNEKSLRKELDKVITCKKTLVDLVDGIIGTLSFSFIEPEYPVAHLMSDEEKLEHVEDLLNYLPTLKESIESYYNASLKSVETLKERIKQSEESGGREAESYNKVIKQLEKEKTELAQKLAKAESIPAKNTESAEAQKLKKMLNEERVHNTEVLEQMRDMHRAELEAASSSKQIVVNQLEGKVKALEEKLRRKKEKSVQRLNETEEILKKQEVLLLENEKLRAEGKKAERVYLEKCTEYETLTAKFTKVEDRARKEREALEGQITDLEQMVENVKMELEKKEETNQDLLNKVPKKLKTEAAGSQTDPLPATEEDVKELKAKLEAAEKSGKLVQQRLLQSYEENTGKIQDLQERLKKYKDQCKTLEDERNGLLAECKRLQDLCDEAKADMKKMMATTKKINNVRSSLSDATLPMRLSGSIPTKIAATVQTEPTELKQDEGTEQLLTLRYEDEIAKLHFQLDQAQPAEFLRTLDALIEPEPHVPTSELASELLKRVEKIRQITEQKYSKEVEELYKQLPPLKTSKRSIPHSLQESIEQLKESLSESERFMEETLHKKVLAERKRICEEIRRTMSGNETLRKSIQTSGSYKNMKPVSPARMSALEQQYKSELDTINNEDICCATGRTISFGIPEQDNELLAEENMGINAIIEECKKKFEHQKTEEFERELYAKAKEYEAEIQKIKVEFREEIERIKAEAKVEIDVTKKQMEENEKRYAQIIETVKSENAEQIAKMEKEKEKEMEELLKLKEKEIRATLSIESMKAVNEKKEELTRQYMENRETLLKDFEALKQKLYQEVENKTERIEQEYHDLIQDSENRKNEAERKYQERIEEKEKLMDNIMKMRIKEIEEEYRIKSEKLEYNLKYEAQCQTERQRAELTEEQKEIEYRYRNKIEELETRIRSQGNEARKKVDQLENELRQVKEEGEQRCDQIKRKVEKELTGKIEQLQKKYRESEEKVGKLRRELEELGRKTAEEKENAAENLSKKYKEELKAQKDKHKSEIRSIKESHKNEVIKKGIEKDREIKKLKEAHATEVERLTKEAERKEIIIKPPEEKKDTEKILQQRINALRRKLEAEYQEKEKTMKAEIDKKSKEHYEATHKLEKTLKEQMSAKYQQQLKEEVDRLKAKYQAKKKKLEELRAEYEVRLRVETKENRIRESNNSAVKSRHGIDLTLSEIDCEGIARENEERLRADSERKRIIEEYEQKLSKLSTELATVTSRRDVKVQDSLQTFVEILVLELDKLLKLANGTKTSAVSIADINQTIAKMIIAITPDGKCREYLEAFKVKLNSVLFAFKHSLEAQYAKQQQLTVERDTLDRTEGTRGREHAVSDVKKYFEVMDSDYERNILTKISPIKNNNGKYVVDVEKVVRDLLLVKEALYSVFQKTGAEVAAARTLEGTSCTILEELGKAQTEETQENMLDNIAKHYRVLLNTILRFAVEAAWAAKEGGGSKKKAMDAENEELLRLKLINAELNEKLADAEQELYDQRKRLALFVGDNYSEDSK